MNTISRREFSQATLGSLLTFSLLETLYGHNAFSQEVQPLTAKWLRELNELGHDIKQQKLPQIAWQEKVESLFQQVDLPELLKFVDFEQLTKEIEFRDRGERSLHAKFPAVDGLPTELVFGHQIFALQKDRSVVPHGHDNMATAFLILQGDFHGRHYDRLEDDQEHMIIKPTIDGTFGVGQYSTVSDYRDNVHWFKATRDRSFIFNIHVMNVEPNRTSGRIYVDPDGEPLSGGRIRAKKLKSAEAYKLYG